MNSSTKQFLTTLLISAALFGNCAIAVIADPKPAAPAKGGDWQANIDKARTLIRGKEFKQANALLKSTMAQAKKAPRDQMYGRYMGLMGNVLFEQHLNKEMIPYAEDALKTFYSLPQDKQPPAGVFFGNHSSLGIAYQSLGKLKQAEQQYIKAVDIASNSKEPIDKTFLNVCLNNLQFCLHAENKLDEEKKYKEIQKKLG